MSRAADQRTKREQEKMAAERIYALQIAQQKLTSAQAILSDVQTLMTNGTPGTGDETAWTDAISRAGEWKGNIITP